jgi:hypothetical protein
MGAKENGHTLLEGTVPAVFGTAEETRNASVNIMI